MGTRDERTLKSLKKVSEPLYQRVCWIPNSYTLTRYEGTEKFYIGGTAGIVLDDGMGYMIQKPDGRRDCKKNLGLILTKSCISAQLVGEDGNITTART